MDGSVVLEPALAPEYPAPRVVLVDDDDEDDDEELLSLSFPPPPVAAAAAAADASMSQATFCRIWVWPQPTLDSTRGSRSERLSMLFKATSALGIGWEEGPPELSVF